MVRTDKNGTAAVEFYTSDETGEYTVIVEGFAADGKVEGAFLPLRSEIKQQS